MDELSQRGRKRLKKLRVKISRTKRKVMKHTRVLRILLMAIVFIVLLTPLVIAKNYLQNAGLWQYTSNIDEFVFAREENINNYKGRTNVLILGKGGAGHEAPDLTDTIMLASVSKENGVVLVSLPRDIWIKDIRAKLNSVYYWGNKRDEGAGIDLAKATVEQITGVPIHYAVVADFALFRNVIDTVGGVDVEVAEGFVDKKFPIEGKENDTCEGDPQYLCRYETVRFETGITHMDGETALKFVRSRQAEGEEGTDFARARRQQAVFSALEEKMLSKDLVLSPTKIGAILNIFNKNIETDVDNDSAATMARYLVNNRNNIESYVLEENLLINPPLLPEYDNLYVFIPKNDNWNEVHLWFENLLY